MTSSIRDVSAYLCKHYPHKSELSKTRLTKLVYLADWESVKKTGGQMTPIRWYFHNFGPYVDDVFDTVRKDSDFEVLKTRNHYGDPKTIIKYNGDDHFDIDRADQKILDNVIDETAGMYWDNFIKHVYKTAPISMSDRYQRLDLQDFPKVSNQ